MYYIKYSPSQKEIIMSCCSIWDFILEIDVLHDAMRLWSLVNIMETDWEYNSEG